MKILMTGNTNTGMRRSENQDRFVLNQKYSFCLVSDGMGGEAGGAIASEITAGSVDQYLSEFFRKNENPNEMDILSALNRAVHTANKNVLGHASANKELTGMGATLSILLIRGGCYFIAHVGDSRVYRMDNKQLVQLTTDHNLPNALYEAGVISKEEAENHLRKNVLVNTIGTKESIKIQFLHDTVKSGDIFLLCSDGLYGEVGHDEITGIVINSDSQEEKLKTLITMANESGGKDNITVCILRVADATSDIIFNKIPDETLRIEGNYSKLINFNSEEYEIVDNPTEEVSVEEFQNYQSGISHLSEDTDQSENDSAERRQFFNVGKGMKIYLLIAFVIIVVSLIVIDFIIPLTRK